MQKSTDAGKEGYKKGGSRKGGRQEMIDARNERRRKGGMHERRRARLPNYNMMSICVPV